MDLVSFLTTDVLVVLAVDLGLFILLIWFLVLWFILREMRQFARQVTQDSHIDNKTYEVCQESVSNALNFTAENSDTLNDLILIQQALENQVSQNILYFKQMKRLLFRRVCLGDGLVLRTRKSDGECFAPFCD